MGMNENGAYFSCPNEFARINNFGDTTLRLDCLGYGNRTSSQVLNMSMNLDDGCRLVLGLGPTPKAYSEDKQAKKSSSSLLSGFSSNGEAILRLGHSEGNRNLFGPLEFSSSTSTQTEDITAYHFSGAVSNVDSTCFISVVDEGSTSAKQSGGYMSSLLLNPRSNCRQVPTQMWDSFDHGFKSTSSQSQLSSEPSNITTCTVGTISEHSATLTSVDRPHKSKRCRFMGCTKGARGSSGLCIVHGGGQRCQKPGCNEGAESRTAFCKARGGGRRCHHLGCTKSAEGKTDHCIAHGGGRRCGYLGGFSKAARGKEGLCIRHGGGKRCKVEGCTKSAEGREGLCISHGGGRRCQAPNCTKGAQGSTIFCKAHGGGKRCVFSGCTKGAEGSTPLCKGHGGGKRCMFDGGGICPKSVHGGTSFCVAHWGGKRCSVQGCTKSARGRTDCCVRHGGGKRCKVENCAKSARGSTDFCKAHGGGKRCIWGDGKCEKFARGRSGMCAAHSSMVKERENKQCITGPGLFHGLVSTSSSNKNPSCGENIFSDSEDTLGRPSKKRHLIPPEVLVPLSMKTTSSNLGQTISDNGRESFEFLIPEGRIHGGGLMSLLGGKLSSVMIEI